MIWKLTGQCLEPKSTCHVSFPLSSSLLPPDCFSSSYLLPVSCKHPSLHPLPLPKFNPLIFTFLFMAHLLLRFKLMYSFSHLYSSHLFPLAPSPSVTTTDLIQDPRHHANCYKKTPSLSPAFPVPKQAIINKNHFTKCVHFVLTYIH